MKYARLVPDWMSSVAAAFCKVGCLSGIKDISNWQQTGTAILTADDLTATNRFKAETVSWTI